ncbi:MAG TPA: 50S ribosomal protein L11 methyltransferase [Solirubrobacteraceae bacterium]
MIRLAIRVRSEQAELVLADLLELAPSGVEEREVEGGMVEYAVYGAPGELPALPDLRAVTGGTQMEISTTELPDDWSERWKQFHRPVLIEAPAPVGEAAGERPPALHVRPPWEPPSARRDVREIVIDPAQAFGTGAHATTRLCLELLLQLARGEESRGALVDVGTGSGVLAIAAAHLGFIPVLALDNERESVEAAAENARVNGVEIAVRHFDLRSESLPHELASETLAEGKGPVILANLLRPLLLDLARSLPVLPRQLIASGLLVHEVDEIVHAFADGHGLRERERRQSGEWAAVWMTAAR